MAPKNQAEKSPGMNVPEPPRLAGGNTLRQAQKPSRAKPTITKSEGPEVSFSEYDRMRSELAARNVDFLRVEDQMKSLADKNAAMVSRIAAQAKVLARNGIGGSEQAVT